MSLIRSNKENREREDQINDIKTILKYMDDQESSLTNTGGTDVVKD